MKTHALLSPSSAHRWIRCAPSPHVEKAYPDTSSRFADEGTAAHEVHEWCLSENLDAAAYLGRVIKVPSRDGTKVTEFEVDEEMAGHVQESVDAVRALAVLPNSILLVEVAVDISWITGEEGASGTADAIVFTPLDDGTYELQVCDLKYGQGVPVPVEDNEQLLLYAAGALAQYEPLVGTVSAVTMRIHQPRRNYFGTWSIRRDELDARRYSIAAAARFALTAGPEGPRQAGDHCKFCKAATDCPTRARFVSEAVWADEIAVFKDEYQVVKAPDYRKLGVFYKRLSAIRDWCNAVESATMVALERGEKIPGLKLVAGKDGNRAWTDEAAARNTLGKLLTPGHLFTTPALKSPAQIEKALPKEARAIISTLTTRAAGKPQVAPETDPRPAYNNDGAAGFEDLSAI